MKYQVREGRNRVVILVISSLVLLVFILAIGISINGAMAWHFYKRRRLTTPMIFDRPFISDAASGDAALNGMLVRSFINLRLSVTRNRGRPACCPAASGSGRIP
jgi:conjugal transfer pilus assembly protein TraE